MSVSLRDLGYDYSSTEIRLTDELRAKVRAYADAIPSHLYVENGIEETPHITVKYGIHAQDPKDVVDALLGSGSVPYALGKVGLFELDDCDVVKIEVDSPKLHELNAKVKASTECTDTFPTYVPHVTIGYLKKGFGKAYAGDTVFEGLIGEAREVIFSSKTESAYAIPLLKVAGGAGSGNFDHAGRPGEVGGSAPGMPDGSFTVRPGKKTLDLAKVYNRRFLFHPDGTLVVGRERNPISVERKAPTPEEIFETLTEETNHAVLLDNVLKKGEFPDTPKDYDSYPLRGFLIKGDVHVATWSKSEGFEDNVANLVERLLIHGINPDSRVIASKLGRRAQDVTIKRGWPDLVRRYRPKAAQEYADLVVAEMMVEMERGAALLADPSLGVEFITNHLGETEAEILTALGERFVLELLGGPGSGNFDHAGRPGEVGGSASEGGKAHHGVALVKSFDLQQEGDNTMRRFLYNPKSSTLVVGRRRLRNGMGEGDDPFEVRSGGYASHAEEFQVAQQKFNAPGEYDAHIKGWIYGPTSVMDEGGVEFYYTRAERLPGGVSFGQSREDYNEDEVLYDAYLKAAEFFVREGGATKGTIAAGLASVFDNMPNEIPFGKAFPELFRKRRAAGGVGSGNFGHAGRPGEVGGSASGSGSDLSYGGIPDHPVVATRFDLTTIGRRRFLYNDKTDTLIIGEESHDTFGVYSPGGHGEVLDEANRLAKTNYDYDDFGVRGFLEGKETSGDSGGVVHATSGETIWNTGYSPKAAIETADALAKLADKLVRSGGATPQTTITTGFASVPGWKDESTTTLKGAYPGLFRARKRAAAEIPLWQAIHRAADSQIPSFVKAVRKAFRKGQKQVSVGQIEEMLRGMGLRAAGGAGSGNFGHAGRPGEVGGSADSIGSYTRGGDHLSLQESREVIKKFGERYKSDPEFKGAADVVKFYAAATQQHGLLVRGVVEMALKGKTADEIWADPKAQKLLADLNSHRNAESQFGRSDIDGLVASAPGYYATVRSVEPTTEMVYRGMGGGVKKDEFELRGPTAFTTDTNIALSYSSGTLMEVKPGAKMLPVQMLVNARASAKGDEHATVPAFRKRSSNEIHPLGIGAGYAIDFDSDRELNTAGRFKVVGRREDRMLFQDAKSGKDRLKTVKIVTVEQVGVF